jgi:hypothetical protein
VGGKKEFYDVSRICMGIDCIDTIRIKLVLTVWGSAAYNNICPSQRERREKGGRNDRNGQQEKA